MMTYRELAELAQVPASRIRRWREEGLSHDGRIERLEKLSVVGLFEFLRRVPSHPSIRSVPHELLLAALRSSDEWREAKSRAEDELDEELAQESAELAGDPLSNFHAELDE